MKADLKLVKLSTFPTEVQEEIVKTLEELLERAKNNEFSGFSWSASLHAGGYKTGFTKSIDFPAQYTAAATVAFRMLSTRHSIEEKATD